MSGVYSIAGLHFFVCFGIFCSCVCRLGAGDKQVLRRIRAFYLLTLMAALASAFGPVLPEPLRFYPTIMNLVFATVVFFGFAVDAYRWRRGPPPDAVSRPAPLDYLP